MIATLTGPNGQTSLEPSPYPYTIGRATDNRLVVSDSKASSHHAQIFPEGQGYAIIDLGSSNGTSVNEQRLVPHVPRLLTMNDSIRIGDTTFVFEGGAAASPIEATVYGGKPAPAPQSMDTTVYGNQYAPAFEPTMVVQSPTYAVNAYGESPMYAPPPAPPYAMPQVGYTPYSAAPAPASAQPQKPRSGKRWLIVGAIVGVLLIVGVIFGGIGYANRATSTKTLNAFCNSLKSGDYKTAYNQLSSGLQARYGSEAVFAAAYSTNGGMGKITHCTVENVNDGAETGTIAYILSGGSKLTVDYSLIDESSAVKINAQSPRSMPSLTLSTYCTALDSGDTQTAYNQLSAHLQSEIGSESAFASFIAADSIKGCIASGVNDAAGTGTITYLRSDGNKTSAAATLTNEQGSWKISALQTLSTPTETLLTYCSSLQSQDYTVAYDQLSSSAQSQETEAQFAANFSGSTLSECKVSNVDDTAGTGSITYTFANGNGGVFDYTLVKENGHWKLATETKHS